MMGVPRLRVGVQVGQTIAFRGLSCLAKSRLSDRRQKAIVCPTSDLTTWYSAGISEGWKPGDRLWDRPSGRWERWVSSRGGRDPDRRGSRRDAYRVRCTRAIFRDP